MNHINKHVVREKELKDWHAMLAAKEMELNGRATSGRADYKAEASIRAIHKVLQQHPESYVKSALTLHRPSQQQRKRQATLAVF